MAAKSYIEGLEDTHDIVSYTSGTAHIHPNEDATMGLPIQDIHAPTVESGPTSQVRRSGRDEDSSLSLQELIVKKDNVEAEMTALGQVLESVSVKIHLLCQHRDLTQHSME